MSIDANFVAGLPMYDLPELQAANDDLWAAIRLRLAATGTPAPDHLARELPLDALWRHPGLLLAQTCGYPLGKSLHDQVQLIATPRYSAQGCDGPFHRSVIVVRAGDKAEGLLDLRGRRCAINDRASNTGMNLLRAEVAPLAKARPFFSSVLVTGAHIASAQAIVEDAADVASIDCVTWSHLRRYRPTLTKALRVLAWSARTPGLPFVAAAQLPRTAYRSIEAAIKDAMADPALAKARRTLLLDGLNILPLTHYRAAGYLEDLAVRQGYPILA
jgi:ABC-type phosphate/phosphonate transport system substrate-binding protein